MANDLSSTGSGVNANRVTRRDFISTTLAGTGVALAAPTLLQAADKPGYKGTDTVVLGKTGINVSRLALGTGFNGYSRSSELTRRGKEVFDRVTRHSLDQGITFLDMADLYGTHPFVKEVIKGIKRDKLVLLSKIWTGKEKWNQPSGGAKEEIDRFRTELGTDMIDICLIHCMTDARWVEAQTRVRDELSELKQKGAIRAVGVSCHSLNALKQAATHPWIDVIFARINHRGGKEFSCDASVEEVSAVLKQARQNGKAVVGMKIFGAGKLVKPEEKDASLKYVMTNQLVDAITIGMLKTEEVDDNMTRLAAV